MKNFFLSHFIQDDQGKYLRRNLRHDVETFMRTHVDADVRISRRSKVWKRFLDEVVHDDDPVNRPFRFRRRQTPLLDAETIAAHPLTVVYSE